MIYVTLAVLWRIGATVDSKNKQIKNPTNQKATEGSQKMVLAFRWSQWR